MPHTHYYDLKQHIKTAHFDTGSLLFNCINHEVYTVNHSAANIISCLENKSSVPDIIRHMKEIYNITYMQATIPQQYA